MKNIIYSNHLQCRLQIREVPEHYPREIYRYPEQCFLDSVEGHTIAVKRLDYNGKARNMMIAYDETGDNATIITIHPISDEMIINRTISGRWKKS